MNDSTETWRRWREKEWIETVYHYWSSLFLAVLDDPETAQKLCELGMEVVRRDAHLGIAMRNRFETLLKQRHDPKKPDAA